MQFDSLGEYVRTNSLKLPKETFKNDNWLIVNEIDILLMEKIKLNSISLFDYTKGEILFGIKTGFNEAYIINEVIRNKLIQEDVNCAEIIKPFVNGENVRKYSIDWKNSYIILAKTGIDLNLYPSVFRYLEKYKDKLVNRSDKGINWWDLRRCSYYNVFDSPKILYPDIALESRFTLDTKGYYPNATLFCIPIEDYYLLAILNSKLMWFYLSKICPVLGDINKRGRLRLKTIYLKNLPIKKSKDTDMNFYEQIVKEILESKKQGKDTTSLEDQINRMVYELYGLTEEEIGVVEGKNNIKL